MKLIKAKQIIGWSKILGEPVGENQVSLDLTQHLDSNLRKKKELVVFVQLLHTL